MAALVSADVTITANQSDTKIEGRRRRNLVKITFGDGVKTYPAGGVPMAAASAFGMVRNLDQLVIFDESATGIAWSYDKTNNKLRGYFGPGHNHDMLFKGSLTSSEALFLDAAQKLGKAAATDRTLLGVSVATDGGVKTVAAGLLEELGPAFAPAAQTLYAEAVGW